MRSLSLTRDRLAMFQRKSFEKLPHVQDLLSRIEETNGEQYYQNVKMPNFDTVKERIKSTKNFFANLISENITSRLEDEDDSRDIFRYVNQILNTEGWLREKEEDGKNRERLRVC